MKILFITPGKLPVPATSGGAVEVLIETLLKDNEKEKKYDITVISMYSDEAKLKSKKYRNSKFIFINTFDKKYKIMRIIRYLINRIPGIYIGNEYIKRVQKILKMEKTSYDYIIIENSPQYSLILQKKYKNLVLHLHNDFLNKNTDMAKKILNSYQKVFTLSNYIKSRVNEIDQEYKNVNTLYNGVEINRFDVKQDTIGIRNTLGINKNDFVFLYTGRLVEEKGVRELILAFNKLNDRNSKLVIVGGLKDSTYANKEYIKKLLDIGKNNKNVIFVDKISYDKIPLYYKIANVGIVPSIWEEPFALTVIEHMATGNPVIVSRSGAIPELVNEECAIIVDKDNYFEKNLTLAMKNIKINIKQYNKEKIQQNAKKFNSEKYCKKFNQLLTKAGEKNEI